MVSVKSTVDDSHSCGGTLIDPLHVLTAAHCLKFMGLNPYVHIGAHTLLDDEDTPGVQVTTNLTMESNGDCGCATKCIKGIFELYYCFIVLRMCTLTLLPVIAYQL